MKHTDHDRGGESRAMLGSTHSTQQKSEDARVQQKVMPESKHARKRRYTYNPPKPRLRVPIAQNMVQDATDQVACEPITVRLSPRHLHEKVSAFGRVRFLEIIDKTNGAKACFERGHFVRCDENVKTLTLVSAEEGHPLRSLYEEYGRVRIEISALIDGRPLARSLPPGISKLLTFLRAFLPEIGWRSKGERYL